MVLSKLAVAILPNTDTAKSVIMSEWKPWHVSFSWLVVRFHDLRQKHRQRTVTHYMCNHYRHGLGEGTACVILYPSHNQRHTTFHFQQKPKGKHKQLF
jgi:hypothetical protein